MRLFINYDLNKISGKAKFIRRLIPALERLEVKTELGSAKKCDAALCVSYFRENLKGIPTLLRIDGVHLLIHDKQRHANKAIKKSAKKSDGIIWQSEFCKKMCMEMYGLRPKKEFVIFNGANPSEYTDAVESLYKHNVIMSARFKNRPQKGLKQMLKLARKMVDTRDNVCFWVAGKTELHVKHERIKFLGHLGDAELRRYLRMADVLLYLAAYDWCPNAVVEGLCAGLPVVYLKGSGVQELVGDCGIGLEQTRPLRLDFTQERVKPCFDYAEAESALITLLESKSRITQPNVHIDNVAMKYKAAFESILK